MSQETVVHILAIEDAAVNIRNEAAQHADDVIAEAEKVAARSYAQRVAQAQRQAEQIVTAGREKAEAERAWILAHAGSEAQHLDATAARNLPHAVELALARITGQR